MSLEKQILSACLSHDFYKDTVEVVSKEMFAWGHTKSLILSARLAIDPSSPVPTLMCSMSE